MQDPTAFQPLKAHFPEQEQLKCPRCESTNTKFCYYNNYNLSQPRHFCKNCRRYWTKGGALRNIPVGGGSRKNTKRSSSSSSTTKRSTSASSSSSSANQTPAPESDSIRVHSKPPDPEKRMENIGGSFSSLLASTGHLGSLLEGLNSNGSSVEMGVSRENFGSGQVINSDPGRDPRVKMQSNGNSTSFLGMQSGESVYWNASSGWSDLAIYTPGSSFQ